MPPQTHADQPRQAQPGRDTEPGATQPTARLSRRSVLRGAAGAGAVGFAAATGVGAAFAATRPSTVSRPADAGKVAATDTAPQKPAGEPLVVYLRDTSTGEFEVFNGTRQVRVRNPRLVAQLLDDLQTAQ
jgi:hypothetical protein